jgi:diguanylate cyclase (GGDEF)-like protein/PAS domain S-box-containing protein
MGEMGHAELVAALREAEARFRVAFSDSPVGRALIGPDGSFVRVNAALCEMLGYTESELLATNFKVVEHPEDGVVDAEFMKQMLAGEISSYQVEKRFIDRRGRTRWAHLSMLLTRDAVGRADHFMAQVVDITAGKQAEASLRSANAQLEALFEHSPAWLSLRGLDGRYLDANSRLAALLSTTREEMIGKHPGEFASMRSALDVGTDDRLIWETREPIVREMTVTQPDGEVRTYHTVRYPVLDETGEVTAIGSFGIDISDRHRADAMRDRALEDLNEAQRIAKVGSWTWDAVHDKSEWSDEMFRIHARKLERGGPDGREFFTYIVRADRRRVAEMFRGLLSGAQMSEVDYRIVADDGTERTLHGLAHADRDNPGTFRGIVQDVTALRAAERDIHAVQERFRRAFEDAPVGMSITTPEGRFLQVNSELCSMLGYTRDELLATGIQAIAQGDEMPQRDRYVESIKRGEIDQYRVEGRLVRADGSVFWGSRFTTALRDESGETTQLLTHVVDVTDRRRMEEELRHLADHDPLTGLLNRRGLEAQLERHIAHVQRYGERGALLMLDLDRFKSVNDTQGGHEAGDQLLIEMAQMLSNRLRASDSIARIGGDEFAILLPESDGETAERVAGEIVTELRDSSIGSGDQFGVPVTASVGVATFTPEITTSRAILVDADIAMYRAKESGRNRVAVHHHAATPL